MTALHTAPYSVLLHDNHQQLTFRLRDRPVKPLPEAQILALAEENDAMLLVEENTLLGGFSSAVLELLADHDALGKVKIRRLGLPDRFLPHGPLRRLRADVGLNVPGILSALEELLSATPARPS